MESIINLINTGHGNFGSIETWSSFTDEIKEYATSGNKKTDKEITINSWRKFLRIVKRTTANPIFSQRVVSEKNETRISECIQNINPGEVFVIDIAKLEETMQAFVFGDVIRSIYDLRLTQEKRSENDIPKKVIVFIDELNKYASNDLPKNSPILRQLVDIAERGRSLGIILFSAEQFRSVIHDRVTGNCSTHAYGRTNAIEISKRDYQYIPNVYKNMMTRLIQGEYILQNPIFRSVLKINFPRPVYKQSK